MTEKRREMEARLRAEREQQRGTKPPVPRRQDMTSEKHPVATRLEAQTERVIAIIAKWSTEDVEAKTEQAEIKAEEAEAKAYEASSLAADASDKADDANTKEAHFLAAQAHDRAAHANSMASIAHQAYADAGGTDPAGSSSDYADTPAEAAKACQTEVGRHMAEAIYHRKQADIGMATVGFLVSEAGEGALGALLALTMVAIGSSAIVFFFGPVAQATFQSLRVGLAF